jgi:cytochrome c556
MIVALAFLPLAGGLVVAMAGENSNPVKERQKLMRSVGKAMKTTVKMLRGDLVYDAVAVVDNMKTMNEVAGKYTSLFPAGSDMENSIMDFDQESDAKSDIWANMDDFKMKAVVLKKASHEAMKAASDKAAFSSVFGNVGKACKGCHQKYKADKKE